MLTHAQGMRGLAIAAIVLYHLQDALCPCGYFGVDVFLVLTGYFLARSDMAKLAAGRLAPEDYLLRKAWRIMPPWMAVAVPVCLLCTVIMGYARLAPLYSTAGSAALGFSNEYVAASGDYFAPDTQENPLMHLWYIGVTVQVYLLALVAWWGLRRFSTGARRGVMTLVGVLSLSLYAAMTQGQELPPVVANTIWLREWLSPYYSVLTRAWEVLAGAGLACLPMALRRWERWLCMPLALLGLFMVLAPMYAFDTSSACVYPAVVGACLLLRYGAGGVAGRVLSFVPLRYVGDISFSLYLVHWPVIAIGNYATFGQPGNAGLWAMAALSLALALLLYYGVEKRCGAWGSACSRRGRIAWPLGAMGAVAALGLGLGQTPGLAYHWPAPLPESVTCRNHAAPPKAPEQDRVGFDSGVFPRPPLTIGYNVDTPARFLLIGDSHAWHLVDGLGVCADAEGVRGVYLNNSCVPVWDYFLLISGGNARWDEARAHALLRWLEEQKNIRCVVVAVYWDLRMRSTAGRDWNYRAIPAREAVGRMQEGIVEMCRRIRALGKEIIVLRDTPSFPRKVNPYDEALRCAYLRRTAPERVCSPERYTETNRDAEALFARLESEGLAQTVSTAPALERNGAYPFRDTDGTFLYRDTNHLSTRGSALVARYIFPHILRGAIPPAR